MLKLRIAMFALALASTACSDDDETGPPSGGPFLNISIAPVAATLPVGGSRDFAVVVTRGAGYPGVITLTVEGLPQNVTATLNPASMPNPTNNSTVTIAANAQATPGSCNFAVRAIGANVVSVVTQTVSCVVTAQ